MASKSINPSEHVLQNKDEEMEKRRTKIKTKNTQNKGKVFETHFSNGLSSRFMCQRLKDSAQSFMGNKRMGMGGQSFSWDNPCDFMVFDTQDRRLYALELKSTRNRSITFDNPDLDVTQNKMIKRNQIIGLRKLNNFDYVYGGFLINFREPEYVDKFTGEEIVGNGTQRTYFLSIDNFDNLYYNIGKKSFTEDDLIKFGAIKIHGKKKIVRWYWRMEDITEAIAENESKYKIPKEEKEKITKRKN